MSNNISLLKDGLFIQWVNFGQVESQVILARSAAGAPLAPISWQGGQVFFVGESVEIPRRADLISCYTMLHSFFCM